MSKGVALCAYAICSLMSGFYGTHEAILQVLLYLWVFDTFTGIIRYYRLGRLRSRSIRYGTLSKTLLLGIPFAIHITAEAVQKGSGDAITSTVFAVLCVAETISILQNIQVAKNGVDITEQDAVSKVLNGLLGLLNKILDNTIGKLQSVKQ